MTAWPFGKLNHFKYGVILTDFPWAYEMRSEKGYEKSPEAHYDTMTEEQLRALPVGELAAGDCLLWMWSTWPHVEQALRLMKHYGFTYKTGGSWTKTTPTGKRAFGTGYILRSTTEPFLIGTMGEPVTASKSERNLIESGRREHSRKPPEAREMLQRLCPSAFKCELFAREPWPGEEVWGNETGKLEVAA
jgi:N6-adenosine-specific RNA methylase IME4